MEVYKEIKGYEGIYEISNFGNVKSVGRYVSNGKGLMFRNERILKPQLNGVGYKFVFLCKNGNKESMYIHRLLYGAFKGELIPKMTIDHIDNNSLNNSLDNLQQITNRLNSTKDKKGYSSKYIGVSRNRSKWRAYIDIDRKSNYLGTFDSEREAAEAYQNKLKNIQQ